MQNGFVFATAVPGKYLFSLVSETMVGSLRGFHDRASALTLDFRLYKLTRIRILPGELANGSICKLDLCTYVARREAYGQSQV